DKVQRGPYSFGQTFVPTQTIHYSGIANLSVHGGNATAGDTFFANSTNAGTTTSLYAGGGHPNEFIIETTGGNLDGIVGPLAVHGASIYDFSIVYDYGNTSAHTYTLSAPNPTTSLLERSSMGVITQDGIGETVLYVPVKGGNYVNVLGNPAGLFA